MPQGVPSRVLLAALLLATLGPGCKQSQVWLGVAEPAASSGDAGAAPARITDAPSPVAPSDPDAGSAPELGATQDAGAVAVDAGPASAPPASTAAVGSSVPAADGGTQRDAGSDLQPKFLPKPRTACPELVSGELRLLDIRITLWVGPARATPGPLLIYWYATGSSTSEAPTRLGSVMDEILEQGGMVAALAETTAQGTDTGTGTWSTGDLDIADEIVACGVVKGRVDPRRIYTGGCSSGGLQAGTMVYLRSGYLAGAQLDSGGTILNEPLQDPSHVPALIAAHGSASSDVVIVNFAELSVELTARVAADGGFAVRCDHGGGHCATPTHIREAQWQFLLAHPFGSSSSPYEAGLPQGFPSECRITRAP